MSAIQPVGFKIRISEFVQSVFQLDGKPYSLRKYPFLKRVYDDASISKVILAGRQVSKSTSLSNLLVSLSSLYDNFRSVYFSPTRLQSSDFSNLRLKPVIRNSEWISNHFIDRSLVDNVFNRRFSNGSQIMIRYAGDTADRARGITTDMNLYDEFQDMCSDVVSILDESLKTSQYHITLKTGTAKRRNNSLSKAWHASTMNYWFVKCPSCNFDAPLVSPRNISMNGPVCAKCSRPVDPMTGRYFRTAPLNAPCPEGEGYHICQLMMPLTKMALSKIWFGFQRNPLYMTMNEVLGIPYENNSCPITEPELIACCDPESSMKEIEKPNRGKWAGMELFMGIDWGYMQGSYTVAFIGGYIGEKFRIIWAKKFDDLVENDPRYQVDFLARKAIDYGVKAIGADWGVGVDKAVMLKESLRYNQIPITLFQAVTGDRPMEWHPVERLFRFAKTRTAAERFREMKLGQVTFPNYIEFEKFARDILAIYVDYRENKRGRAKMYYDHDLPDDSFWALNYCRLVADLMKFGSSEFIVPAWTV